MFTYCCELPQLYYRFYKFLPVPFQAHADSVYGWTLEDSKSSSTVCVCVYIYIYEKGTKL